MAATFNLFGSKDVQRVFNKLPDKVQKRVLRKAVKDSAKIAEGAMEAQAPHHLGFLVDSITTKVKRYRNTSTVVAIVGPKRKKIVWDGMPINPANYAHLVEFGTKPHLIAAKGGVLEFAGIKTRLVHHPGAAANPFMRRSWMSSRLAVLRKFQIVFGAGVGRAAKRLRRRRSGR